MAYGVSRFFHNQYIKSASLFASFFHFHFGGLFVDFIFAFISPPKRPWWELRCIALRHVIFFAKTKS